MSNESLFNIGRSGLAIARAVIVVPPPVLISPAAQREALQS
jgi:hypothetical protein